MDLTGQIERAVDFLTVQRKSSGWWNDFTTLAGYSDEWVTGYIATALAGTLFPEISKIASEAWGLLRRRRPWSKGWGYNRKVPKDTDSTIWCLHLAEATGNMHSRRAARAYKYLARAIHWNGGLSTYPSSVPIRLFTGLMRNTSFEGWCSPHPCVSAAFCNLKYAKKTDLVIGYLRATQKPEGNWRAYWWCDDEYPTSLAVSALITHGVPEDQNMIQKAAEWNALRITSGGYVPNTDFPRGSPFATALALRILMSCNQGISFISNNAIQIAEWLMENQLNDGSWTSSARLRIPPPGIMNPEDLKNWSYTALGGGSIRLDQNRLFTTATVVNTLNMYRLSYQSGR
jgi:hypothetical protein